MLYHRKRAHISLGLLQGITYDLVRPTDVIIDVIEGCKHVRQDQEARQDTDVRVQSAGNAKELHFHGPDYTPIATG